MIIGLTGQSGSGKSFAAKFFEQNGFVIIDFDKLSREVTGAGSPCLSEIEKEFGVGVICENGSLNRRALGEIVFADSQRLATLNSITHKYILKEAEALVKKYKGSNIVFDAPLLFQANLHEKCDYCLSILADEKIKIARIMARDGISKMTAANRLASQPDDEFFLKKSDKCIYNNADASAFEKELSDVLGNLFKECN